MSPLDIPRLEWGDWLGEAAVASAYRDLTRLTSREVLLHSRTLVPGVRRSFYCAWSHAIHIFIGERSAATQCELVHEILHGMLVEEGYGKVAARLPTRIQPILSNELQHPEIFRRMEAYGIDMSRYWREWDRELRAGLEGMRAELDDPCAGFFHFPRIFTWFFFRQVAEPHLDAYRNLDPALHDSAQAAYEDTRMTGFQDAAAQRDSLMRFKSHWYRYCERHLPNDECGADLTIRVRDSAITPMMEFESARQGGEIIDLLRRSGLWSV